ncbi:MAG: hypothetical protein AB7E42_03160 [Anaerotignaceae bacterium]
MKDFINKLKEIPFVIKAMIAIAIYSLLLLANGGLVLAITFLILPFIVAIIIYTKTYWKKSIKFIVSAVIIVIYFTAFNAIIFDSNDKETEPVGTQTDTSKEKLSEEEEPEQVVEKKEEPEQEVEKKEENETKVIEIDNPYMELTKNKADYLLLLKAVGESFLDLKISGTTYSILEEHKNVLDLVNEVLGYKVDNKGALMPEFEESYYVFAKETDNLKDYAEVTEALGNSFVYTMNYSYGMFGLKPKEGRTLYDVYTIGDVDYYSIDIDLKVGDIVYVKNGQSMTQQFEVLNFGENKSNEGGTNIGNAVLVKPLNSMWIDMYGDKLWRDLSDIYEGNEENLKDESCPLYYVKLN